MKKIVLLICLISVSAFGALPPSPIIPRSADSTVTDIWSGFRIGSGGLGYNRVYNVKNLGAKGDGTTSDYRAFDSALTLIMADTMGGAIYLPPGQYLIDTMLFAVQSPMKRFYMYGHGSASRIIIGDSGFIQIGSNTAEDGSGRWYFKDFEIANSSSNTNGKYGISLREGGTFGIQNVNVYGAGSSDYLDYAFYIVSSQQGSISDLSIKQCAEGVYLKDTTIVTDVNPNQVILDRLFISGGATADTTFGVHYDGSQTGVLSNSHITACSVLVMIESGEGIRIENNQLEGGTGGDYLFGIVIAGGSNAGISNNWIYAIDTSIYLKGGNKSRLEGNLFNSASIFGAGATKNSIVRNLFGEPVIDSVADTIDNRNRYFGNLNQSTGDAYQGLKINTQTGDANDFYLLSTGDIEAYLKGVDSTYINLFASGGGHVGIKLEDYHRIFATANSGDGIQFATYDTTTGADSNIVHFQLKGAHPYPQAIFKDISGLKIGEYTLDTADGTNGQALVTDGSGNVAFATISGGSGLWTQNGDSSIAYFASDSGLIITVEDDTTWLTSDNNNIIIGDEGLTISDSLLTGLFYIVLTGGTDTAWFDTSGIADNYIWKYNSATGNFELEADGGSGSPDSAIVDFGSGTYKSSSDKAWSISFGSYFTLTTPTDSGGVDTFTVLFDTSGIALIIEDSLNEYVLTSTANSTYEVQLNNEAGLYSVLSDVSDFLQLSDTGTTVANGSAVIVTANAIYDWAISNGWQALADSAAGVSDGTALFVTSNGVYDYINAQGFLTGNETVTLSGDVSGSGATSITVTLGTDVVDSTNIPNASIAWNDLDTASQNISHLGQAIDSTEIPDASVAWNDIDTTGQSISHLGQTIEGSEITNQTIVGDDIDSTSENFVFNNAYKVTSAVSDSEYVTVGHMRDSTLSTSGSLDNPSYVGDVTLYGNLRHMGVKNSIDIDRINFQEATSHLDIDIPDAYLDSTRYPDSLYCDSNHIIHPDVIYIPHGFQDSNGDVWKYIFIGSPYPNGSSPTKVENPCVYVSNDNETWVVPTGATNPIADTSDITPPAGYSKYLSDPGLFWDENGNKIWAFWRLTLGGNYSPPATIEPDTNKIYVMSTTDLVTWSTPVAIITSVANDIIQGTTRADTLAAMGKAMLSPAIVLDTGGTYRMVTVESNGCYGYLDSTLSTNINYPNTMTLWTSVSPDSGWDTVQTIVATPPEPTFERYLRTKVVSGSVNDTVHEEYWHQDITVVNADLTLMFLKTTNIGGSGSLGALYIGYSTDNCRSFTFRDKPIIDGMRYEQNSESSDYTYKASGILVESENELKIGLYYSAFGNDPVLGTDKGRFTFYTESNYLEDTLSKLVLINDSEMRVYGRYDPIQSSDSIVLTQSVWDNTTANTFLFIDSSYDAVIANAVTDTVALTFQSPEYCVFDSLIIAFHGNSTTSYVNQVELLGDYKIGISQDTSTAHQNLASYDASNYKYIVNDTNYTSTSLARKAIPMMTANFADSAAGFVWREGERGQIRLIMNIHCGGYMKVSYIQLKGRVVDRIDVDRQDERYHLR